MHLSFSLIIFLLSLLFLKIYQRLSIKFNIIDIPGSLSIHSKETPTGAGIVFVIIFFLSIFLNQTQFDNFIKFDHPKNYLMLLVAISSLALISFYDDLKNIHPLIRLFSQLTIIFICTSLFDLTNINLSIKF